ncbi:MAG: hypothetical protein LBT61_04405 [Prevotellaceae bacterium]|nr:hypothetical protein [Prevotellaceae bacterium]
MTKDYIPSTDAAFNVWQRNLINKAEAAAALLGITADTIAALRIKESRWEVAFAAAENPQFRTKLAIREKQEARKDHEATLRSFNNSYLIHNPAMTDVMREDFGLPIHKTTRTPSPVATTYPDFDIDSSTIRRLTIHFYNQGQEKSKAKPAGQHGAEIRWAISDVPVVDVADLIHSSFDTHTPFTLEFEGHERGKTVYFCLCWENTRGEKGPWSEIVSAIIP